MDNRKELLTLGLATTGVLTAALGLGQLVQELKDEHSDVPLDVPFPGWQVWALEAVIGLVLLTGILVLSVVAVRRYRDLRSTRTYRRLAVILALFPSVLVGGGLAYGIQEGVVQASLHTSASEAAHAALLKERADFRKSPTVRSEVPAADSKLAAHMLTAAELGPRWYDAVRPNPRQRGTDRDRAGSVFVRSHWNGQSWVTEALVSEVATKKASPAAALAATTLGAMTCGCTPSQSHIHGTTVTVTLNASTGFHNAAFAVGSITFAVLTRDGSEAQFAQLVDHAVLKAQRG